MQHYFLRKRDIERSEAGAKACQVGSGAKPLEAECVPMQFIFEMKIESISLFPRCIHYRQLRQAKTRNEHWYELDIRKLR